jgi:DNA-binding PadR family transcriptional regulator
MAFREDLDALVLAVLQRGPTHGYEISRRIRELSEKVLSAGEGKLYPCLHKLEQDGYIQSEWVPQESRPARKVYCLTDKGSAAMVEKRRKWEEFVAGVSAVLTPPKPEASRG